MIVELNFMMIITEFVNHVLTTVNFVQMVQYVIYVQKDSSLLLIINVQKLVQMNLLELKEFVSHVLNHQIVKNVLLLMQQNVLFVMIHGTYIIIFVMMIVQIRLINQDLFVKIVKVWNNMKLLINNKTIEKCVITSFNH